MRARIAQMDRLTAARLWLPALRELEARAPSRVDELCARAGIERDALEDPRRRVSLAAARKLLRDASRETNDALFALLAGRRHARESVDVFMRMLIAQPDFETAIGVARRFASLPIEGLEVSFLPEDGLLRVMMALSGEPIADPLLAEYVVGVITQLVEDAGYDRLRLLGVELAHAPRAEPRAYRRALGAPVSFGCARIAIVLPNVNVPLRDADPLLATVLAEHAEAMLGSLPSATSYRDRVAALVLPRLENETLGIDDVAAALGMSARTLRRRLADESTTFAEVLDETRRNRAIELLGDEDRTVAEIAAAVGFASTGAFRRAFQRWTGTSASRYRMLEGDS